MKKILLVILLVFTLLSCASDGENTETKLNLFNTESIILQESNNYTIKYMLDKKIFSTSSILSSNNKNIKFNNLESLKVTEDILSNGVTISLDTQGISNYSFGSEFIIYDNNSAKINGYILSKGNKISFILDPYKTEEISSPLSGELNIVTNNPVKIKYEIMNRDNENVVDVSKISNEFLNDSTIDIYGLYENYNNIVRVIGYNKLNMIEFAYTMKIKTENVVTEEYANDKVLNIKVDNSNNKGWFITHYKKFTHPGMLIDEKGYVRWVLKNIKLNYGFPVRIVDDNVIEIVPYRVGEVKYYSFTGKEHTDRNIALDALFGYQVHHDIYYKPDGNYLIASQKTGASTVEDIVLEYNPVSKQLVNIWDFNKVFDSASRKIISTIYSTKDWLHINSVWYDERDNTIIISARHQGVLKATYPDKNGDFKILWWLTPHIQVKETNPSLLDKLLYPVDKNGNIINDNDVLLGNKPHNDFEWNRGQHSVVLLKNGNILLYDNGNDRPYVTQGQEYSRLVEYKIDEKNMTVQQVRQYGKELGLEMYSWFRSNVLQFDNLNYFINSASVKSQFDIKEFDINNNLLYDARGLWENYRIYKQKIFIEHYN